MPQNVKEQIQVVQKAGGSGCIYMRGSGRPYADVSVVMVSTVGKNTDYAECLKALSGDLKP